MIDNQGRIKGRVSIIDILIVLAVVALVAGFIYRQASPHIDAILTPDAEFQITFEVNRIRSVIAEDAIVVGEYVFRQHNRQPIGRIVSVERQPATDIMMRSDGTALLATMDDRYMLHITIEATGTVSESGIAVNGNDRMAAGTEVALINRRFIFPLARVYSVDWVERVENGDE
ncbi:MAG: DUF4330 domain-containing protein [Defluviitaleaceae bacterium]|nr:DUF4330 domain-containing protein [Defluviitaleaceae bacterium]